MHHCNSESPFTAAQGTERNTLSKWQNYQDEILKVVRFQQEFGGWRSGVGVSVCVSGGSSIISREFRSHHSYVLRV